MGELKGLDHTDPHSIQELIKDRIDKETFANFLVSYLAGSAENDLHIHGVRKKYNKHELKQLVGRYPGYNLKTLQNSRINHIDEIFQFVTSPEAGFLFANCENRTDVIGYFYKMGKLLEDLGLIQVSGLGGLEKLSKKISQYDFFFEKE